VISQKSADFMAVNVGESGGTFPKGTYLGGPLKGVRGGGFGASHII